MNSLWEVLILKQSFQKNKVVTVKTLFFVIGLFGTPNSICLNIGFWQGSLVWNVFSTLVLSTKKTVLLFSKKGFCFPENLFQSYSIKNVQNFQWLSHKNMSLLNGGLFWKPLLLFFRKANALPVSSKMEPLRDNIFLC